MRRYLIALIFFADCLCAEVVTSHLYNGDSSSTVDIVVMGDGFTSSELGAFRAKAAGVVDQLFSEAPFSTYSYLFNVWFIDVESLESGADHPSRDEYKNTALGAAYDCLDIERLICIESELATTVLNANVSPEQQDILLVLVNDSQYGGSGGYFAVSSVHENSNQIMEHEIGHAFGSLGDEYWIEGEGPGEGLCDIYGGRDQPNASRTADRDLIPWNEGGGPPTGWIEESQPLPSEGFPGLSVNAPQVINTVGAFLGGNHCDDQYRPTDKSKMRDQSAPWGPVNADLLLEKIHTNSDMIKSFSPPNAAPISELTSNSALSLAIAPGVPFNDEISWEKVIGSTASAGLEIKSNTMVSSVINIEQSGQVVLDTFSIDIDIDHTYRGDLSIELISPSNTAVPISGYANGNLLNSLDSLGSSNTPNATTNFFATLEGESITGEWTLKVSDTAAGDEGILNSWGINYDAAVLLSGSSTLDLNQIDPGIFKVKATLSDPSSSIRMSATQKAASESIVWELALEDNGLSCDTFGTSGAYVQKIFIAYLGRPAAPAGLQYYANYLDGDNEQGKLILFDDLYYSAEAEALYSTSTLSEQINQFYQFMFSRDALSGGLNYWIDQINGGFFTVPASAAYIADAASGEDMAVLDAKQVAASKLTCAIGDDASKLSAFQANLASARASIAEITTAEEAEAYDGETELASIIGSARTAPNSWLREAPNAREANEDAQPIPSLPMLGFFILSGLLGLFGIRRLAHR